MGVDVVHLAEDNTESAAAAERRGPAGVEEQGTFTGGFSRNLGGPTASVDEPVLGIPVNNPWPAAITPCACGNEAQGAAAVPAERRKRSNAGGAAGSRSALYYQGSGGTNPRLCQEDAKASCCTRDEGGPFGAVL